MIDFQLSNTLDKVQKEVSKIELTKLKNFKTNEKNKIMIKVTNDLNTKVVEIGAIDAKKTDLIVFRNAELRPFYSEQMFEVHSNGELVCILPIQNSVVFYIPFEGKK